MARKKKAAPALFETVILEHAAGAEFVAFVEQQIRTADSRFRGSFFKSASEQDRAREQRLRLGRLLFWLKNGLLPLGATEEDKDLYRKLAEKRPVQPHPFLARPTLGAEGGG